MGLSGFIGKERIGTREVNLKERVHTFEAYSRALVLPKFCQRREVNVGPGAGYWKKGS